MIPPEKLREKLRIALAPFEVPNFLLGVLQIATSLGLYVLTVGLMYWFFPVSPLLTLLLAIPAAVMLVRVFIVQHDCGHASFFRSRRANDILGTICGVLTLAPYAMWRRQHSAHHANWNNLDRRESGLDFYTVCLTVDEYRALSPWHRFMYRMPRHPLICFFVIPPLVFLVLYRLPFDAPKTWTRERRAVLATDLAILTSWAALVWAFGLAAVLIVQLPIVMLSSMIGFWLFSVQHRFETARWMRRANWTHMDAAMSGSSYLALPRLLHWMTGNIGFHHIHHLSPRVPNYRLAACHRSNPILRPIAPLSLGRALAGSNLVLWDEVEQKLIRFRDVRLLPAG
jgi:acyl-lipid omega-6 desaturase (Delta-12 desaturase)